MLSKGKKILILLIITAFLVNAEGEGQSSENQNTPVAIKEETKTKSEKSVKQSENVKNEAKEIKKEKKEKKENEKRENEKSEDSKKNEESSKNVSKKNNEKTAKKSENQNTVLENKDSKNVERKKENKVVSNAKKNGKEKEKEKIDKNKPVVKAVEKELEGISYYNGNIIKFIATTNGNVLKKVEENKKHPIASLTKIMNIVVALDQVDKGNANLDDKVCFTQENVNVGGSWLNAKVGDCFELRDLLRAEIIYSANNASYLVAHHIGKGSIDNFVNLMNEKAKELGMKDTTFYTPTGLPTSITKKPLDISTAYDLYLLGKEAIKDERISEWAGEQELVLLNSKGEQVIYNNRNKLLDKHGIFGLKTGFHSHAGYNMMVASKKGNIEIISVTFGNKTDVDRTQDQSNEFTQIEKRMQIVYKAGQEVQKFKIKNGKKKQVKGVLSDNVYQLDNTNYTFNVIDLNVTANADGIKKGDVIGKIEVIEDNKIIKTVDILSSEDTSQLSAFGKMLRFVTFGLA